MTTGCFPPEKGLAVSNSSIEAAALADGQKHVIYRWKCSWSFDILNWTKQNAVPAEFSGTFPSPGNSRNLDISKDSTFFQPMQKAAVKHVPMSMSKKHCRLFGKHPIHPNRVSFQPAGVNQTKLKRSPWKGFVQCLWVQPLNSSGLYLHTTDITVVWAG